MNHTLSQCLKDSIKAMLHPESAREAGLLIDGEVIEHCYKIGFNNQYNSAARFILDDFDRALTLGTATISQYVCSWQSGHIKFRIIFQYAQRVGCEPIPIWIVQTTDTSE